MRKRKTWIWQRYSKEGRVLEEVVLPGDPDRSAAADKAERALWSRINDDAGEYCDVITEKR